MQHIDWNERPRWPYYPWEWLDETEAKAVRFTWHSCGRIGGLVDRVRSSVELYQFAKQEGATVEEKLKRGESSLGDADKLAQLYHWQRSAGQSAALNMCHFADFVTNTINQFELFQSIWPIVDKDIIAEVKSLLVEHFPSVKEIRNGVSHEAARHLTLEAIVEHAEKVDGKVTRAWFGVPKGDNFEVFYQGELLFIEMTESTPAKMEHINRRYFDAFEQVELEVHRQIGQAHPFGR